MDYVSTVVEKDKCRCYRWEKYHNSAQKNNLLLKLMHLYLNITFFNRTPWLCMAKIFWWLQRISLNGSRAFLVEWKYWPDLKRLSLQLLTFFDFFYFLYKWFVKVELSYVFTINLFTIAENCTEKWIILKNRCVSNYLRPPNYYRQLILT